MFPLTLRGASAKVVQLFRRIMQSANHRTKHAYRLSYSLEVGSSFDPDLEDASTWESELKGTSFSTSFLRSFFHTYSYLIAKPPPSTTTSTLFSPMPISTPPSILHSASKMTSSRMSISNVASSGPYPIPDDVDDEELQAYAEQCAVFADFADIDPNADEFASLSDLEEEPEQEGGRQHRDENQDRDMDTS